jgi:hypothetical protein
MQSRAELLRRALEYPYAAPRESFVLSGERMLSPEEAQVELSGREPLIAYASNASPHVLRRKLGPDAGVVPATKAVLEGFDAVYSAHVSAYAAVPATLHPCPTARLPVFVLHLTEEQRAAISATEPNYESTRLAGALCALEGGGSIAEPIAYLSRHGVLLVRGEPLAVAEIEAAGRTLRAAGQRAALEAVRRAVRPDVDLEAFIVETAGDAELPARWTEALRSDGGEAPQREPGEDGVGGEEDAEVGQWPA